MIMYDAQKAKGLFIKLKYKKFQASILKRGCIDSKRSNDYDVNGAKWKTSSLCGRSYIHISIIEIDHISSC